MYIYIAIHISTYLCVYIHKFIYMHVQMRTLDDTTTVAFGLVSPTSFLCSLLVQPWLFLWPLSRNEWGLECLAREHAKPFLDEHKKQNPVPYQIRKPMHQRTDRAPPQVLVGFSSNKPEPTTYESFPKSGSRKYRPRNRMAAAVSPKKDPNSYKRSCRGRNVY